MIFTIILSLLVFSISLLSFKYLNKFVAFLITILALGIVSAIPIHAVIYESNMEKQYNDLISEIEKYEYEVPMELVIEVYRYNNNLKNQKKMADNIIFGFSVLHFADFSEIKFIDTDQFKIIKNNT